MSVLSIDGMRPDLYRRPDDFGLKIPNLRRLVEAGASADAVETIYPSTTYPAHATLVTGVQPRVHGIYSHLASRDPTEPARPWHWFASALRVPALWDAARSAGLTTAAISWPVSAGAAIDYNIPEIWNPALPDPHQDFQTAARHSTPGLFEEVVKTLGPRAELRGWRDKPASTFDSTPQSPGEAQKRAGTGARLDKRRERAGGPPGDPGPYVSYVTLDRLRSEAAIYLWQRYRPDLLLVHFLCYDASAHDYGPLSPEALAALEQTDEEIGRIQEALENQSATVIVLSDHGFVPVEREAAPQIILADEGLFDRHADGTRKLARLGAIHAGGSFAVYWLEPPTVQDKQALQRALRRIRDTGAVAEVLDRVQLEALGADPDAEFIWDAAPGFYFSDRFDGPAVQASQKDHGTHGHLPSRPGLEASFVVRGAGITPGKNLGRVMLTQIAPTLAQLLGLPAGALRSKQAVIDL